MLDLLEAVNPVIGLSLNVLVQILTCRYISKLGLLKAVFVGFLGGAVSVLLLQYYIAQPFSLNVFLSGLLTNLIVYTLFGYCYFHFVNLGETARRIRIVRELYDNPAGLSLDEILKRYDSRNMVEMRINRLVNNGQVIFKGDRYFIGNPFLLTSAKLIGFMKMLVIGKRSEFD